MVGAAAQPVIILAVIAVIKNTATAALVFVIMIYCNRHSNNDIGSSWDRDSGMDKVDFKLDFVKI